MIDSFHMTLTPNKTEVSRARRFVTEIAHQIGQEELADIVELLTSELVTNAILHGGNDTMRISVGWAPPVFRVEVQDHTAALPQVRRYSTEATTGRGLTLVTELSSRWGATPIGGNGKSVWFEMLAEAS